MIKHQLFPRGFWWFSRKIRIPGFRMDMEASLRKASRPSLHATHKAVSVCLGCFQCPRQFRKTSCPCDEQLRKSHRSWKLQRQNSTKTAPMSVWAWGCRVMKVPCDSQVCILWWGKGYEQCTVSGCAQALCKKDMNTHPWSCSGFVTRTTPCRESSEYVKYCGWTKACTTSESLK